MAVGAKDMLLAGFTSIRDVHGPVFGIKRAIDEGLVAGPRICHESADLQFVPRQAHFPEAPFGRLRKTTRQQRRGLQPSRLHLS